VSTPNIPEVAPYEVDVLVARAVGLVASGRRRLLGIVGGPGAGKSTLAEQLVAALGPDAALVPMDGFHLANDELDRLGIRDRKGAIDTFDAAGFVTLLRRLRTGDEPAVYAPLFRRDLEEAIAGSIRVPASTPLVVTEGNYLLVEDGEWSAVRGLLDEAWFLEPADHVRLQRLVTRHVAFGRDQTTAEARARGSDQVNAELIATTRGRADLVIVGG
jgi:pantothenate kinase